MAGFNSEFAVSRNDSIQGLSCAKHLELAQNDRLDSDDTVSSKGTDDRSSSANGFDVPSRCSKPVLGRRCAAENNQPLRPPAPRWPRQCHDGQVARNDDSSIEPLTSRAWADIVDDSDIEDEKRGDVEHEHVTETCSASSGSCSTAMGFSDEPLGDDSGGSTAMLSPASAVFFPMRSFQPVIGVDCGAVDGYGGAGVALHAIQCYGSMDDTVGQSADYMGNDTLQGVMSCSTWQSAAAECHAYYSTGQSSEWGDCAPVACFMPAAFLVEAPEAERYAPETYELAAYEQGGPWPEQWVYEQPAGHADSWPVDYRPGEFNASADAHEQARSQALHHARRLFGQM